MHSRYEVDYRHITSRCFVNAPWYDLKNHLLDTFLQYSIQPEIGLEGLCLYEESESTFRAVAEHLQKNNLSCTLHAPFFDLAPGSLDPDILACSRNKLKKAFALIDIFKPKTIVCHLNFEENKQGYKKDAWEESAFATWNELLQMAIQCGCRLMLENTYEQTPEAHKSILSKLNSKHAGFCLDVGHLMSFAKCDWQQWLPNLSPWLGQLHLHDNNGVQDQHLAPGRGNFDFQGLFQFFANNSLKPLVTLEPHSEEDLWQALAYLDRSKILDMISC